MTKHKREVVQREKKGEALPKDENGHFLPNCRGKTKVAVDLMIEYGLSDKYAAQRAGVAINNLRSSMKRPGTKAYMDQRINEIRSNEAQMAYLRIRDRANTAKSDRLRHDADVWLAGVDGLSPAQKVQAQVNHRVSFGNFDYGPMKDVTPGAPDE